MTDFDKVCDNLKEDARLQFREGRPSALMRIDKGITAAQETRHPVPIRLELRAGAEHDEAPPGRAYLDKPEAVEAPLSVSEHEVGSFYRKAYLETVDALNVEPRPEAWRSLSR
jgi:hypothetical protein